MTVSKHRPQHRDSEDADLRFEMLRLIMADASISSIAKNCATALLLLFMNSKTGQCNPRYEVLARALGFDKRRAMRGVRDLVEAEWVRVHHVFGDRDGAQVSNSFEFLFERLGASGIADAGTAHSPTGGSVENDTLPEGQQCHPLSVDGVTPGVSTVSPQEQRRDNKEEEQVPLFGEGKLSDASTLDPDLYFETKLWPQYPRREGKARAKAMFIKTVEGTRRDRVRATKEEILAGVLRYAAAEVQRVERGGDPAKTKMMEGWLNDSRWTDEYVGSGRHHASASTEAVWAAGKQMAARNKRAVG